jgi:hypothetical protein
MAAPGTGSTILSWGNTLVQGAVYTIGTTIPKAMGMTSTSSGDAKAAAAESELSEDDRKLMCYQPTRDIRHPLCSLVTLALFHSMSQGTKLGLQNYTILIQPPGSLTSGRSQAKERQDNNDNHIELMSALEKDIKVLTEWYSTRDFTIYSLFQLAIWGLKKLQATYSTNADTDFRKRIDTQITKLRECCIYKPNAMPPQKPRNVLLMSLVSQEQFTAIKFFFNITENSSGQKVTITSIPRPFKKTATSNSAALTKGEASKPPLTAAITNPQTHKKPAEADTKQKDDAASATTTNGTGPAQSHKKQKDAKSKHAAVTEKPLVIPAATADAEQPLIMAAASAPVTVVLAQPKPAPKSNTSLPDWLQNRECQTPTGDQITIIKRELDTSPPINDATNIQKIIDLLTKVNKSFQYQFNKSLEEWANLSEVVKPLVDPAAAEDSQVDEFDS